MREYENKKESCAKPILPNNELSLGQNEITLVPSAAAGSESRSAVRLWYVHTDAKLRDVRLTLRTRTR